MPWNFHVTKRYTAHDRDADVTLREWTDFVEKDPDLILVPSLYATSKVTPMTAALWFGHPDGHGPIAFELLAGNITVARPDAATLGKLNDMAGHLGGHVEDDDGGWYDTSGHFLGHLAAG